MFENRQASLSCVLEWLKFIFAPMYIQILGKYGYFKRHEYVHDSSDVRVKVTVLYILGVVIIL